MIFCDSIHGLTPNYSDYNPLHVSVCYPGDHLKAKVAYQIDPSIGKKLGFGGCILHGLCFYGIVSLAPSQL